MQFALTICAMLLPALVAAKDNAFHPAQTEAEKALDDMFKYDEFSTSFEITHELKRAVAIEEKRIIEKEEYIAVNSYVCAQDTSEYYLYSTSFNNGTIAKIARAWPGVNDEYAIYWLVKHNTVWKIDAIQCPHHSFNTIKYRNDK